jgi:hypothetical protein
MGTEPAEMNTVYRRLSKHVIEQLSREGCLGMGTEPAEI